jgi:hypothetical protein
MPNTIKVVVYAQPIELKTTKTYKIGNKVVTNTIDITQTKFVFTSNDEKYTFWRGNKIKLIDKLLIKYTDKFRHNYNILMKQERAGLSVEFDFEIPSKVWRLIRYLSQLKKTIKKEDILKANTEEEIEKLIIVRIMKEKY